MSRQSFTDIRTEVLKRLGRTGDTATQSRVEHWIDGCYRELAQTWFHHELTVEPPATAAVAQAAETFALPADCYLVLGVRLLSGSTPKGRLAYMRPIDLLGNRSSAEALPQHYTRLNSKVYMNCPANAAYTAEILYYRRPTDPAFTSAVSELDELFDEPLIEWATAKGQGSLWRPDLASQGLQSLAAFWQRIANPPIASGLQRDRRSGELADEAYAEALG